MVGYFGEDLDWGVHRKAVGRLVTGLPRARFCPGGRESYPVHSYMLRPKCRGVGGTQFSQGEFGDLFRSGVIGTDSRRGKLESRKSLPQRLDILWPGEVLEQGEIDVVSK